ncbi:MAG TPA: copper resistance protein B [Caulobacteraceae bacterium]
MIGRVLAVLAPLALALPTHAQHGHGAPQPAPDPHAGHVMPAQPPVRAPTADPHAGHHGTQIPPPSAEIPDTPPPPPPADRAADRFFDQAEMDRAVAQLRREHGGMGVSKVMLNLAEYQAGDGGRYRWDAEAWFGGDYNRLVLKSEGEGGGELESAEVQALFSRAVSRYFDLQAGVRQDFGPSPRRTYVAVGAEGLFPYWFEVEGALFLSHEGELFARAQGSYDLRLTQRLILQPRAELNFAAQETPELGLGSGLTNAELGLRLRYEVRREFGPYVGVSWDRKVGRTADFARIEGEDPSERSIVFGVRAWF